MAVYSHPHPEPYHVMWWYRRHLLSFKRSYGSARGLMHYRALLQTYRDSKRSVIAQRQRDPSYHPEIGFPWTTPKVNLTA